MMINDITAKAGAHKPRKRVGRGESSGTGKTSGRGHKGYQARSGGGPHSLHEGGQMPIFRRIPKRGFNNANFRTEYDVVNLASLEQRFSDGDTVGPEALHSLNLVGGGAARVKVLAKGELTKKLTVEAHAFSGKAREAIERAGGKVNLIDVVDSAKRAREKRNSAKNRTRERKQTRLEKKRSAAADGQ